MRILAVGAHPDDVEFGCAPILIQESRAGHEVRILVTSKGEAATAGTPEERAEESRQAAAVIGAEIEFLDLGGDCNITAAPENAMPSPGSSANSCRTSSWRRIRGKINIPIMRRSQTDTGCSSFCTIRRIEATFGSTGSSNRKSVLLCDYAGLCRAAASGCGRFGGLGRMAEGNGLPWESNENTVLS